VPSTGGISSRRPGAILVLLSFCSRVRITYSANLELVFAYSGSGGVDQRGVQVAQNENGDETEVVGEDGPAEVVESEEEAEERHADGDQQSASSEVPHEQTTNVPGVKVAVICII